LSEVAIFLPRLLRLDLHPDKVFIKTLAAGVDFLGWIHFPHHRVLRTKTKRRMLRRLRSSPKHESLQSYLGIVKHGDAFGLKMMLMNDYWLKKEKD